MPQFRNCGDENGFNSLRELRLGINQSSLEANTSIPAVASGTSGASLEGYERM
tara:strand:- start:955 stop:1113 length:159 start_codon:yes stop_codon:yes gene_type:complete